MNLAHILKPSYRLLTLLLLIGVYLGSTSQIPAHAQAPVSTHVVITGTGTPTPEGTPVRYILPLATEASASNSEQGDGTTPLDVTTALTFIVALVAAWPSLYGVSGVIAGLVNILKPLGIVTDGNAPRWYGVLNLILFAGVALLITVGPFKISALNSSLGLISTILVFAGYYIRQLNIGSDVHAALVALKLPGVSTSFSAPSK